MLRYPPPIDDDDDEEDDDDFDCLEDRLEAAFRRADDHDLGGEG